MVNARVKHSLIGVSGLGVLAVIVALCLALYGQSFVTVVPITIHASRSGLLMESGAAVKVSGVVVGQVKTVSDDGGGATIALDLQPGMVDKIPADVSANIVPPTVFGAKYVDLIIPPGSAGGPHIERGAVIGPAQVNVEVNTTFSAVMNALQAMPPTQLNAALSSVASTLRGRGGQIGSLIKETNSYLHQFNPSLPTLSEDVPRVTDVSTLYNQITPDLITTASNAGTLSNTLVAKQAQLAAFLLSFTRLGNTAANAASSVRPILPTTLNALQPTVQLLERYSPELPCLFQGVVRNDTLLSALIGGPDFGGKTKGANVTATVDGGSTPSYKYPQDLPVVGANSGPDCHGLPNINKIVPYVNYPVGTNVHPGKSSGVALYGIPLTQALFGSASGTKPEGVR